MQHAQTSSHSKRRFFVGALTITIATLFLMGAMPALANSQLAHLVDKTGQTIATFDNAKDAIEEAYEEGTTLIMDSDWTISESLSIADGETVTIDMNDHKVSGIKGSFSVGKKSSLTLTSSAEHKWIDYRGYDSADGRQRDYGLITGGVVTGGDPGSCPHDDKTTTAGGISISEDGTLTLDGVTIAGNRGLQSAGGVKMGTRATLNMKNGATIEHNIGCAGGVRAWGEDAKINMVRSFIKENYGESAGGGIEFLSDGAEVSMTEGSEISNNTSLKGGGIEFCESYFRLTSKDSTGRIWGNQAKDTSYGDGGGVLAEAKGIGSNEGRIENITFFKNHASVDGGALELDQEWTRVINCTFTENTAEEDGGAIYVSNDDNSIEGCTIRKNACSTCGANYEGGGVFVGYRYDIKMTGVCIIKDNCRGSINSGNKDDVFLGTISGSTGFAYITGGVEKGSSIGVRTGIDTKDRRIGDKINNATKDCFFMDMSKFHVSYGTDHGGDMWQRLGEAEYTLKVNGTTVGRYKQGSKVTANGASDDPIEAFQHWNAEKTEGLNPLSEYIDTKSSAVSFTMPATDVSLVADYIARTQSVKLTVDAPEIDDPLPTTGTLEWKYDGKSCMKTVAVSWLASSDEENWTPASGAAQPGLAYKAGFSVAQDLESNLAFATDMDASKQQVFIGGSEVGALSVSTDSSGRLVLTSNPCSTDGFQVIKIKELSMRASKGETKEEFLSLMPSTVKATTNKNITLPLTISKDEIDLSALLDDDGKVKVPEQGDTVELEVPVHSTSTVYVPENLRTTKLTVKVSSKEFEKVDEPTADTVCGSYTVISNPERFDEAHDNFIVDVACSTDGATIKYSASYWDDDVEDEEQAETIEGAATDDGKVVLPVNEGGRRTYSVELWAEKNESESSRLELYYVIVDNSASTVRTVSIEYADTAMEGQHGYKETEQYKLGDGEMFVLAAPDREGYVFEKWQMDGVDVKTDGSSIVLLDEVTEDTTLTAVYNPVISSLSLGIDTPTAHERLMDAAEFVKVKAGDSQEWSDITSYFGDGRDNPAITWSPEGDVDGNAKHDTVYTAMLSLAAGDSASGAKYALADDVIFYVNDTKLLGGWDAYTTGTGDTAQLCVKFPETGHRVYKELAAIDDVELTFAQACGYQKKQDKNKKASWGLPKEVQVTFQCGETETLDVEWEAVNSFDKDAEEAQEITVAGTVDYPSYVDKQDAPETITATLEIAESHMYTVTFDSNGGTAVPAQTVKEGSSITVPDEPSKTGRAFKGWANQNGDYYNVKKPITSDITLYAQWGLHPGQVAHLEDEDGNELGVYTNYVDAVEKGYDNGIVVMDADWELEDTIRVPAEKNLTIDMNGHKMTFIRTFLDLDTHANVTLTSRCAPVKMQYSGYNARTGKKEDLSITTGGLLTGADLEECKDSDGTIPAHPNLIVGQNATLTLDGIAVAGNRSPKSVGGVRVRWKATLNMKNGASIEHNYGDCGGVEMYSTESVLNMENSFITGNYATGDGGGVKCTGDFTTINMSKGSKINDNGTQKFGGGVGVAGTDFKIQSSDGEAFISGNYAKTAGGGICTDPQIASQDEGYIQNITIAENTADSYAGGLYLGQEWTRIIGCTFTGNTAAEDGGAIYVDNDDNYIQGCTITGNACDTSNKNCEGGGVFVSYKYDIHMTGKCIVKNNCRGSIGSGNDDDVFLSTISGSTGFAYITGGVDKGSSIGVRTGIAGKDRRIGDKINNATKDAFFMDLDGYYVSYGTDHGGDMWQRNTTIQYLMQLNGQDVGRYAHNAQVTLNGASTDSTKVFKCWSEEKSEHLYPFEDYVADVTNPQVTFKMPGTDANLVAEYITRTSKVTLDIDAPSVGQRLPAKGTVQWTYDGKGKHEKVSISWLAKDGDGNWVPATGSAEYATDYKAVVSVAQDAMSDLAFALNMVASDQKVTIGSKSVGASEASVDASGTLALTSNVYTTAGLEVASVDELAVKVEEGTSKSDFLALLPSTVKALTAKGTELALDVVANDADFSALIKDDKVAMPTSGDTVEVEVPVQSPSSAIVVPQELSKTKLAITVTEAPVQTPDVPTVSAASGSYSTADHADQFEDGCFVLKVACSTEDAKVMHSVVYRDEDDHDGKMTADGEVDETGKIFLPVKAKGKCMYSVELWAEKDGLSSSKLQLNYVLDDTASVAKYTVTVKFADTAVDGQHGSKDPETHQVVEGDAFSYTAPQRDGYVFEKWTDADDKDAGTDSTIQLDSVTADTELTAVYNPVVSAIDVYFALPQADAMLEQAATEVKAKIGTSSDWADITSYFANGHGNPELMWSPEADVDGQAAHGTAYAAKLALASKQFSDEVKYVISSTATCQVNGGDETVNAYMTEKDGVTYLCVDCPATEKYEYESFEQPDAVELTYDQALTYSENLGSNWGLPESVKVNYACGETGYVPVRWTGVEGFSKDSKSAQELTVTGVLQFPSDVSAQDSATVTCKVNVAAPGKAADVEVSEKSGTYLGPLKIKLATQTEGATIRYTLDGSEPTEKSTLYSGAFKIKHSATLKAKAFRENMQDSDTVSFEYTIEHKVIFDSDGGSAVDTQRVVDGELATKPADPTKNGYTFKGWYAEDGGEFSFETPVTGDITLSAQWEKTPSPSPSPSPGPDPTPAPSPSPDPTPAPSPDPTPTPGVECAKSVDVQLPEVAAGAELPDSATAELTRADGETKVQVNVSLTWLKADGTSLEPGAKAEAGELKAVAVIEPSADPAVAYDTSTAVTFGGKAAEDGWSVGEDGKLRASFKVAVADPSKIDISQAEVKLASIKLSYNGKLQRPEVASVMLPNGTALVGGVDYQVSSVKSKKVGKYELTIIGVGDYTGAVAATYKIVPAKVTGLKAKAAGKGKVNVSWKKAKAQRSGVQVRYAKAKAKLKKNKGKAVKAKGASAKSKTLKRLKSDKRYYFKVRAYKIVNGKKYYSAWSKVKSAKVKRK